MNRRRNQAKVEKGIIDNFYEMKGLPRPSRVVGGATVYHRHPEFVRVVEGRDIPDRIVDHSVAPAELPLPIRIGEIITKALHLH